MLKTKKEHLLETIYLLCLFEYICVSLFTISYVAEFIDRYINHTTLAIANNWFIAAVLVVIYLIKPHESKKDMILEIMTFVLFVIVTFTNQNVDSVFYLNQCTIFFVIGLFMICAPTTTFKRITATSLAASLFIFAVNFYLSQNGYVYDLVVERFGTYAHSYGYYYYAQPSYYMLFAWLAYMYVRGKKEIGWIELTAEFGLQYLLYKVTTCRLGFLCAAGAFVLYIIIIKLKLIKLEWKITKFGAVLGFPAFAAFTLLTGFFYSSSNFILIKFNKMINGRVLMVHEAFNRYDLNLFGRLIIPHTDGVYFFLDAGYAYELFGCGIVFFIVVLAMYSYMFYYACKTDDKPLFIWLATLMVFGIVGDVWVGISYTAIILGFFIMFKDRKNILKADSKKSECDIPGNKKL